MPAAPFASQQRAGREVARPPLESLRQRYGCGWRQIEVFEKADRGGIEVADRLGLQTIGEHRKQKMPGEVRWRVVSNACAPSGSQPLEAKIAQARDLGFDGGALGRQAAILAR